MIRGVGLDVVALGAFRDQLADRASTFIERTFTPGERRDAASRPDGDPARHLAVRYAAKEALIKAWAGAHFGEPPLFPNPDLQEIEVVTDAWGRPALRLHGAVADAVEAEGPVRLHLSLTHDGDVAMAIVVVESAGD